MDDKPSSLVSQAGYPATPLLPSQPSSLEIASLANQGQALLSITADQQAAISTLKDFGEGRIFTWLTVVRSVEPCYNYAYVTGGLSKEQLTALFILRNCRDSDISLWLQWLLLSSNVNSRHGISRSSSGASTASTSRHPRRPSNRSSTRSSITSFAASTHGSNTSHSTPRSSFGLSSVLDDLPEDINETEDIGHTHWCPECDKCIGDTCDGWKRHMKEHETYWSCLPLGPIEETSNGPRCAFCGVQDPDSTHIENHRSIQCCSNSKGPTRKSRRSEMVKHLAKHWVFEPAATELADRWQCSRNKRAFACGFCVKPFYAITEQLNHIDNEHYSLGADKSSWDISNIIKGLLRQPKVHIYWQRILALQPTSFESHVRWEPTIAESLQTKLETGEETGADLALTAFDCRMHVDEGSSSHVSTNVTVPLLQRMAADHFASSSQQSLGHSISHAATSITSSSVMMSSPAITSRYHSAVPSRSNINNNQSEFGYLGRPHDFSLTFPPPFNSGYFQEDSAWQQIPMSHEADGFHHMVQYPAHGYSTQMTPADYGTQPDQNVSSQGHLNSNIDLSATQLGYPDNLTDADLCIDSNSELIAQGEGAALDIAIQQQAATARSLNHQPSTKDLTHNARDKPLPKLPISARTRSPNHMDVDGG